MLSMMLAAHAEEAVGEAAHAAHEGGATLQLLPDMSTLVQQVILFTVLAAVLYKFAWKHILHALEEREGKIKGDLDAAEASRKEAESLLVRHKAAMDQAKGEAQAILDEGKKDALRLKETILAEAREEAAKAAERSKREIALAGDKAVQELQTQAAALSVSMASRILGREVKASDQDRLIQESLGEFKRQTMNG